MCGRYHLIAESDYFAFRFHISESAVFDELKKGEIFPTNKVPVIINDEGVRKLKMVTWGMIPSWAKTPTKPLINARSETIAEKPTFKNLLHKSRCLIPASGFYEWATEDKKKIRHLFRCADQDLFAMAGLLASSKDGEASVIITGPANALVAQIHDRMPMILKPKDESAWLADGYSADMQSLLAPYVSETMTMERQH